jgi:hypothetical protein
MVPKCGSIVTWHWAHKAGGDCEPWAEPESAWHLAWKARFAAAGACVEVVLERDGVRHRADVVLPGGRVVELQHGYMSAPAIRQREAFYGDMVWLYDAGRFWDRVSWAGRQPGGFWWRWPARSLLDHRRPMLWHVQPNVYFVRWLRRYGTRGTFGAVGEHVDVDHLAERMVVRVKQMEHLMEAFPGAVVEEVPVGLTAPPLPLGRWGDD